MKLYNDRLSVFQVDNTLGEMVNMKIYVYLKKKSIFVAAFGALIDENSP